MITSKRLPRHLNNPSRLGVGTWLTAVWFVAACSTLGMAQVFLSPLQASERINQNVTVCGQIGSGAGSYPDGRSWLEFNTASPTVRIVVEGGIADLGVYKGRAVCVTGRVEPSEGRPEIRVPSAAKILVFDAVPEIVEHLPETTTTGITQPARVLLQVKPVYDRATAKDGSVTMECIVLADGSVGDVRIESSLDPALGLDQAAVLAVKRWRFVPAKRGVESVPSRIRVELFFVRR